MGFNSGFKGLNTLTVYLWFFSLVNDFFYGFFIIVYTVVYFVYFCLIL